MRSLLDGDDGTDVKIAAERYRKLKAALTPRAQIAPALFLSLLSLSRILLARKTVEPRVPRICELTETSDKLNHWHNCSLNRPEMSPDFQEVVLLADGLRLAVGVPGNGNWAAGSNAISGARFESEKILRG